jgi:hypothetical protein
MKNFLAKKSSNDVIGERLIVIQLIYIIFKNDEAISILYWPMKPS